VPESRTPVGGWPDLYPLLGAILLGPIFRSGKNNVGSTNAAEVAVSAVGIGVAAVIVRA
jgi:hypothetical protein